MICSCNNSNGRLREAITTASNVGTISTNTYGFVNVFGV